MRASERVYERMRANERIMVERPGDRRVGRWYAVRFLFGIAAMVLMTTGLVDNTPWIVPVSIILGWIVGEGAGAGWKRANSYRWGWLEGRTAMVAALGEALRRGMTPDEWLEAQAEKDAAILGG